MSDSSSFSSESSQEERPQQPVEEHNAPAIETAPQNPASVVNGVGGENVVDPEPQEEEERTLTDHLNKRLLESFLARLDSGSMQLPQGARGADPPEEEDGQEFED
jgi:hypothetical protein